MDNKYDLSRNIPEEIKREVRKRCGFGCIICGNAIYQYEHFLPEFNDATKHDPEGITLLCGGCHDRKTRGQLSLETIIECNANPKALEKGFSWGPFDIGKSFPEIILGNVRLIKTRIPLQVFGDAIFSITPPENDGESFKINATLRDRNGNINLQIINNEWQTPSDYWDCIVEGQRISLNSKPRSIELVLRIEPPHKIIVERLYMIHYGNEILCKENGTLIFETENMIMETSKAIVATCEIGIDITPEGIKLGSAGAFVQIIEMNVRGIQKKSR